MMRNSFEGGTIGGLGQRRLCGTHGNEAKISHTDWRSRQLGIIHREGSLAVDKKNYVQERTEDGLRCWAVGWIDFGGGVRIKTLQFSLKPASASKKKGGIFIIILYNFVHLANFANLTSRTVLLLISYTYELLL
jgi:hypothetical protein